MPGSWPRVDFAPRSSPQTVWYRGYAHLAPRELVALRSALAAQNWPAAAALAARCAAVEPQFTTDRTRSTPEAARHYPQRSALVKAQLDRGGFTTAQVSVVRSHVHTLSPDKCCTSDMKPPGLKQIRQSQMKGKKEYPDSNLLTRVSGVKDPGTPASEEMIKFWGDWVNQIAFVSCNAWENVYSSNVKHIANALSDLWRQMFVQRDGTVTQCDVDYKSTLNVGSLKNSSVSSA